MMILTFDDNSERFAVGFLIDEVLIVLSVVPTLLLTGFEIDVNDFLPSAGSIVPGLI